LTYEYKDIDKCLLLSGYTRIPNKWPGVFGQSFQFNPPICFVGKFNKLEGRDVDKITVIQLDAGCNESEVLSRRWEFNCENKEVYLYTSDGNRTFYGLWAPRSLGNYACYVFGDTGRALQP
jgi:hypothetical protein